jgi:hypothetical protein
MENQKPVVKTYQTRPCAECPWRTDVVPGKFEPERFVALAHTAYDQAEEQFGCHKASEAEPVGCAGFVLAGAEHNIGARVSAMNGRLRPAEVSSPWPLFSSYREMAVANGVPPDHPALRRCRG